MEWKPQPKQELFLKSSVFELLFGGTKGPGKTDALLAEATRQLSTPNYRAIIFRRTFPKLQEIIDRSHRWFTGLAKWNGEIHRWTWPNGAFLQFGHCKNEDDKYNYQGHEYQFMGFDQLEEFTETQYLFLITCCRTTDPTLMCYIRATANPGNVGHAWVKIRFIDKCPNDGTPKYFKRVGEDDVETIIDDSEALSRGFLYANIFDNPILIRNDPKYLNRLKQLPPKLRKALLDGDWNIFEGQFFNEWDVNLHIISQFDSNIPHEKFMALDYGFSKPASIGWYAILPEGNLIRYREFYSEGYTYEGLAYKILEINKEAGEVDLQCLVADPSIWGDRAHHERHLATKSGEAKGKSGYQIMQEIIKDKFPILKADNRRIVGWIRVREYLKPYRNQHNEMTAKFLVTKNCRNFIRTIVGLIHDDHNPEDLNTNGEDHSADEVRYAIMTRPMLPTLPQKQLTPAEDFWQRVKRETGRWEAEVREEGEGVRQV